MVLRAFKANDSYDEFKKLCIKEGVGVGDKLNEFIATYIKEHGDGNPAFTMDQFIENDDFAATPALYTNSEHIQKFLSRIKGTKQYTEIGDRLNIWARLYNKEQKNERG